MKRWPLVARELEDARDQFAQELDEPLALDLGGKSADLLGQPARRSGRFAIQRRLALRNVAGQGLQVHVLNSESFHPCHKGAVQSRQQVEVNLVAGCTLASAGLGEAEHNSKAPALAMPRKRILSTATGTYVKGIPEGTFNSWVQQLSRHMQAGVHQQQVQQVILRLALGLRHQLNEPQGLPITRPELFQTLEPRPVLQPASAELRVKTLQCGTSRLHRRLKIAQISPQGRRLFGGRRKPAAGMKRPRQLLRCTPRRAGRL